MQGFNQYPFYSYMSTGDMFDFPMNQVYETTFYAYNDINQYQPPSSKDQYGKAEEKTNPGVILKEQESEENKLKQFFHKVKKQKIKDVQKQADDDYKPYRKNKKRVKICKQKEDRNLIPNSVNHLLAFVQKRFKSGPMVQRIFIRHKHPERCNINRYYSYHKMLGQKINNYVNTQAIKIVTEVGYMQQNQFTIEEQRFYCKISRILINNFLKEEVIMDILHSKKIKKKNVYDHLKVQRTLLEKMKEQLFE